MYSPSNRPEPPPSPPPPPPRGWHPPTEPSFLDRLLAVGPWLMIGFAAGALFGSAFLG